MTEAEKAESNQIVEEIASRIWFLMVRADPLPGEGDWEETPESTKSIWRNIVTDLTRYSEEWKRLRELDV